MEVGKSSCFHRGWFAVLSLNVDFLVWTTMLKSLGIMLPTLTEQFSTKIWLIGWTGAIVNAAVCFVAPLCMPLEAMFGTRAVVMTTGFMVGMSMILASFSTSVVQLMLILALLAAPGLSFANILPRAMIGRYFPTTYATATGIGTLGNAFSMIFMAPLVQLLLNTYGWRGAMLLLGGISLHLGVCGTLLRPPPSQPSAQSTNVCKYQQLPAFEEQRGPGKWDESGQNKPLGETLRDALLTLKNCFKTTLWLRMSFWIALLVVVFPAITMDLWLLYFFSLAETHGFSESNAIEFTIAGGVGSFLAKISLTAIVDRGFVSLRPCLVVELTLSVVSLVIFPWMNSYWYMMANTFIFHSMHGVLLPKADLYTRELLGANELITAFSWYELVAGILEFTFGFCPGWIFHHTGSYELAFYLLGGFCTLPLVALLIEHAAKYWKSMYM